MAKIVGVVSLDELLMLPSSTAYRLLAPMKKEAYEDDERIHLVAKKQIRNDLADHINWLLMYLDIPEFFVELQTDLESNSSLFPNLKTIPLSTDVPTEITEKTIPLFDHHKLCAHPWSGLHVWTDGSVSLCCDNEEKLSDKNGVLSIRNQSLKEIMSGSTLKDVRQSFRNGQPPKSCSGCYDRESKGLDSRRTLAPYRLQNIYGLINWESEGEIGYIGTHPTNLCNLGCRICGPKFSSIIESEEIKHNQLAPDNNLKKINEFYDEISSLDSIKNFEILGGEPFLIERNIEFMQDLISSGRSKECIMQFTTNGTVFPDFFRDPSDFLRLEITFSIDDVNERFEYQRHRASWEKVKENIEHFVKFKSDQPNIKLGINATVNIQNVLYLDELMDWYSSSGLDHYNFSLLSYPKCLSITKMTPEARSLVMTKLSNRFDWIKDIIANSEGSNGEEFCNYMSNKDQLRKQRFQDHHRDIAQAMGMH